TGTSAGRSLDATARAPFLACGLAPLYTPAVQSSMALPVRGGRGAAVWVVAVVSLSALVIAVLRPLAGARHPPPVETQLDIPPFPSDLTGPLSFGFRSLVADMM